MSLSLSILYTTSKQSNKIMYSIDITSFAFPQEVLTASGYPSVPTTFRW